MNTRSIRPTRALNNPASTAMDIRQSLMDSLRRSSSSTFACFYTYARHHSEWRVTDVCACGEPPPSQDTTLRLVQALQQLHGPDWDPEFPTRHETPQRFHNLAALERHLSAAHIDRTRHDHLTPLHIKDAARVVLYHGARFIGCLGLFRAAHHKRFTSAELSRYNDAARTLRQTLIEANRRNDRWSQPHPLRLILGADAQLQMSTHPQGDAWLTPRRLSQLTPILRRLKTHTGTTTALVHGAEVHLTRLLTADPDHKGSSFLLTVHPPTRPQLNPMALLTGRQREVADFAAAGATSTEIADTLGISTETVRKHLKAIYQRLGVGNRVELSEALRVGK